MSISTTCNFYSDKIITRFCWTLSQLLYISTESFVSFHFYTTIAFKSYITLTFSERMFFISCIHMGQCPAKSGLWDYNFITIKIAHYTNPHIFATVQPFPFILRTHVSTSFLYVPFHFEALIIFYAVSAKITNPTG